jgi:hypothetical protein
MKRMLSKRATPSMIVAMVALFAALSGISYAAATALPRASVGTLQLKANAVNSTKVLNHSLLAADFKSGQIPKGPKGATGATGATGAAGAAGAAGAPGLAALQVITGSGDGGTGSHSDTATCPTPKKAISGGYNTAGIDSGSNLSVTVANITSDGLGYRVDGKLSSGADTWNITAQVVCATVAS